jgi:LacI family transcriptional regulator
MEYQDVGLILPEGAITAMDFFLTESIRYLSMALADQGYHLVLFKYEKYDTVGLEWMHSEKTLAGVILFSPSKADAAKLKVLIKSRIPVTIIFSHYEGIDSFACANEEGGYIATKHLLDKGRKRIAFMHGHPDWMDSFDRYNGYLRALKEYKAEFRAEFVRNGYNDYLKGMIAAREILGSFTKPDALFCANDKMAMATIAVAAEYGLKIPGDLSVIGFDDIFENQYVDPPLTTMAQPVREIVEKAAARFVESAKGETLGKKIVFETVPPKLIIRKST